VAFCIVTISLPFLAEAGSLKEARLTSGTGEINLIGTNAVTRQVSLNEALGKGTILTTGADSRAELTFNNHVVARLSANAIFNLKNDLELVQGAMLIQAPGRTKGKVHAADVAVDVSGATAVIEHQAPAFKFLVLEGTVRLYRPSHLGDSILVHPGQMVFGSTKTALADPVDFEIERFVKTCPLIRSFDALPNEKSLAAASARQQREKSKKSLIDTNLVIFGGGSNVSVVDSAKTAAEVTAPGGSTQTPAPRPNPSAEVQP
jgi:hypothetical protein